MPILCWQAQIDNIAKAKIYMYDRQQATIERGVSRNAVAWELRWGCTYLHLKFQQMTSDAASLCRRREWMGRRSILSVVDIAACNMVIDMVA